MKPISKISFLMTCALFLLAGKGMTANADRLFSIVPADDATYSQLQQLEKDGVISAEDAKGPLTRFEVAQRIFKAEDRMKGIAVAQADMDLPPPPPDGGTSTDSTNGASTVPSNGAGNPTGSANSGPALTDDQKIADAEKNLRSLQEAYDFELKLVKDQKADLESNVAKAEADQFDLWKNVKGITEYPSASIHGIGRAFGISQQYYGTYSNISFPNALFAQGTGNRYGYSYLDLIPTGSISKEVRWNMILRLSTNDLPIFGTNASPSGDSIVPRWISGEFNPDFMSASLGDFYESYTPLTLWNRNSLDLFYKPEMLARYDDIQKYESFMNLEPALPFRGLRIGTSIGWPTSDLLDSIKASAFVHMIKSGFTDKSGGWYVGPDMFTDLIFAGNGELKTKKWYVGGTSWQLTADTYGVILDEPLDSTQPGSPYGKYNSTTWAHQYLIGSFKPSLKIGFGGDLYMGLQYEGAFSSYQEDKRNPDGVISDFSIIMGPSFQLGDSKLTFNYLNVGPNYYSPLAQTRQDNITQPGAVGPDLLTASVRNQFFLTDVPRPSGIFAYYDRTQDNTFPYGLATPNRQGFGGEIDVETLKKKSLKIKGAAYFVQEISGNLVVDSGGTGYTGLDTTPSGAIPLRTFTYVNMGPSYDLGPEMGLNTPLEIGMNARYEQTTSIVGTLTSTWLLGGARVGLFDWWEISGSYSWRYSKGTEEGLGGTPIARYSYLFDSTDLGHYSAFTVDGSDQDLMLSTTFNVNRNSKIHFDYSLASGTYLPYYGPLVGTLNNQFMELTYEIEF